MKPESYLYLVETDTDNLVAVFTIDHIETEREISTFEARLRIEHGVDDPNRGLALRDSRVRPLSDNVLGQLKWKPAD